MVPKDPTGDEPPNFLSEDWQVARDAIARGGETAEEAAQILLQGWQAQHEKNIQTWNEYIEQRRRDDEGGGEERR